jgi:hypothetical protein
MLCEKTLLDFFIKKTMWWDVTSHNRICDITWREIKLFFWEIHHNAYGVDLTWFLHHKAFWEKGYTNFETTFWKFEVDFFHFGINFHLIFGNSHFTHTKVESEVVCIGNSQGGTLHVLEISSCLVIEKF